MSYKTKKRINKKQYKKGGSVSDFFKDKYNKGTNFVTTKYNQGNDSFKRTTNSLTTKFNTLKAVSKMSKEDRKNYFAELKKFNKGVNFDENCKNLDKCNTNMTAFLKSFEDPGCPLFYKKLKNLFDCYNNDDNTVDKIDMIVKNEDEFNDGTNLPDNLPELIQKAIDWAKEKELRSTIYDSNDYDPNYIPDNIPNYIPEKQDNAEATLAAAAEGGRKRKRQRQTKKRKIIRKRMRKTNKK